MERQHFNQIHFPLPFLRILPSAVADCRLQLRHVNHVLKLINTAVGVRRPVQKIRQIHVGIHVATRRRVASIAFFVSSFQLLRFRFGVDRDKLRRRLIMDDGHRAVVGRRHGVAGVGEEVLHEEKLVVVRRRRDDCGREVGGGVGGFGEEVVEMGGRVVGDNGSDGGGGGGSGGEGGRVVFAFDVVLENRRVRFAVLGVGAFVLSP